MSVQECPVCCANTNKRNKEIVCLHCGHISCMACSKRYILESINDAKCMDCGKFWNREFLIQAFNYSWVTKDYKKHRQSVLFDRQLSMMETTQVIIEERRYIQENKDMIKQFDEKLKPMKREVREINTQIRDHKKNTPMPYRLRGAASFETKYVYHKALMEYFEPLKGFDTRRIELRNQIYEIDKETRIYWDNISLVGYREVRKQVGDKYYGHCPMSGCKGFITASWKCGLCDIRVCRTCKERVNVDAEGKVEEGHVCDPNTLLNLAEIKQISKHCPKCKVPIVRVSGCRQMWCVECHVAFDWQTGEIELTRNIHNPHYFEWKNKNRSQDPTPAPAIDVCAQRIPDMFQIEQLVYNIDADMLETFTRVIRILNHIEQIEIRRYRMTKDMVLEYRIEYMTNKITEKRFKQKLQNFEKKREKYTEITMIYEMFIAVSKTNLYSDSLVVQGTRATRWDARRTEKYLIPITRVEFDKFITRMNELVTYTNECFARLKSTYKNKIPVVSLDPEESESEVDEVDIE